MEHTANPNYALGQLARVRDPRKLDSWVAVFEGMMRGILTIGSRQPVAGLPTWVTLEVLQGGFTSGRPLAGGELETFEQDLERRLDVRGRAALNEYFLSEEGLAELAGLLESGCYRVDLPEEGALLTVAWLASRGQLEQAERLVVEIKPHFANLRFYPRPALEPPAAADSLVQLQPVGKTAQQLRSLKPSPQILKMREALTLWVAFYDRLVELFTQLEEPQWESRAARLLADFRQLPAGKKHRPNYARLLGYLETPLGPRERGMIRRILSDIEAKRGLPGSQRLVSLRQRQALQAELPMPSEVGEQLAGCLEQDSPVEGVLKNLSPHFQARMERVLRRSWRAPLEVLIEQRVIPSGEVLARVLPQLTAQVERFSDLELTRLYQAIYAAFRRRRSLLLLNLQSQVKLTELPWIAALQADRQSDEAAARALLRNIVQLTLRAWPNVILPNKLLQELGALARAAGLRIPLVDEVAADIFMGEFSEKFRRAAQTAAGLLEGSLYQRYYAIDCQQLLGLEDVAPSLARICEARAGLTGSSRRLTSRNGRIIEQEQILTTHNLAVLWQALQPELDLGEMTRLCFRRIRRLNRRSLHGRKEAAYAWRQLIFFLSLQAEPERSSFMAWARQDKPKDKELLSLVEGLEGGHGPYLGWR